MCVFGGGGREERGGGGEGPLLPCILQKCVIAEWPGWFVFEKRLEVVKMAKTDTIS